MVGGGEGGAPTQTQGLTHQRTLICTRLKIYTQFLPF